MPISKRVNHFTNEDLKRIRRYLKRKNKIVLLSFINIGVNIALRHSDLSTLKFEDIKGHKITVIECKTKKVRNIYLNKMALKSVKQLKIFYTNLGFNTNRGYLFKSLSNYNKKHKVDKCLTQVAVYYQFKELKENLNIKYPIGTHSLRKTWGHRVYQQTHDLAIIMIILNHSSARETLKYIGVEEDNIRKLYEKLII